MIVLKKARLFDGQSLGDEPVDILIDQGRIGAIGERLKVPEGAQRLDLGGKIVAPGFIDLHGHFRDPGQTWREDIASGSLAAAAGGYVLAVAMPNTEPPLDTAALVRYVRERGAAARGALVIPAGCVSKGRRGREMAEMGSMVQEGAVLFTDDGSPVRSTHLFRQAMLYCQDLGVRIMEHPEELELTGKAQVNEGRCSAISGMTGFPETAEVLGVTRAVALARELGCPVHLTHLSTARALEEVRLAKEEGLAVTCDVTPHHLVMSEEEVLKSGLSGLYKVNPPLRSPADLAALWDGLWDGTVDAIATDHAPYHADEKDLPFQEAAFGIAAYECAVAAVLDRWRVNHDHRPLETLLTALTSGPARILPLESLPLEGLGRLVQGGQANLTVLDLNRVGRVDPLQWRSKARLTPYQGHSLRGWPVLTMIQGRVVFSALEEATAGG